MKYMLLIFQDPTTRSDADMAKLHEDYFAYTQAIMDSKEFVNGDPLCGTDSATTVRVKNGDRIVTDGPFVETREWLSGYYTVDVADLDRALELAAQIPGAKRGWDTIEVRPVMDFM